MGEVAGVKGFYSASQEDVEKVKNYKFLNFFKSDLKVYESRSRCYPVRRPTLNRSPEFSYKKY